MMMLSHDKLISLKCMRSPYAHKTGYQQASRCKQKQNNTCTAVPVTQGNGTVTAGHMLQVNRTHDVPKIHVCPYFFTHHIRS